MPYICTRNQMVIVAQLVRASDCGSEGRGFETRLSPLLLKSFEETRSFFIFSWCVLICRLICLVPPVDIRVLF